MAGWGGREERGGWIVLARRGVHADFFLFVCMCVCVYFCVRRIWRVYGEGTGCLFDQKACLLRL